MREGSLEAPTRHALDWRNPDFYDMEKIDAEMRRVFDICHGCRRCFNLCDSFPRLFDLIDKSPTGELDGVKPADYKQVVDACTLCDLCFMTKCPYVPPHEWALDFPHLMLRYRAAELKQGKADKVYEQLTETDRNGKAAELRRAGRSTGPNEAKPIRALMQAAAHVDAEAKLPKFYGRTLVMRAAEEPVTVNTRGAGLWPQGRALCHLLLQLQQSRHRHGGAHGAGA